MNGQSNELYEQLLTTWYLWREIVNNYCRTLQLLMQNYPDNPQQWQELRERIAGADRAFREADAQLSRYEAATN